MANKIAVDPELLEFHAKRVDAVAASVQQGLSAAQSINLGGGAFGLMCNFLVLPTTAVSMMAVGALSSAGGMVTRSATQVRAMARDFERYEGDVQQQVSKLLADVNAVR